MDDPNAVEVDEQMPERTLLVIRFEECAIPVYAVETHETLCWWNVDQASLKKRSTPIGPDRKSYTYLICKHNASNALWIPEQLVNIIVTNDAIVITFSSYKFAIHRLIALITNEAIKWLDNSPEVESLWDGIDAVLAIGGAVVVIGAFENKAEALGHESDLRCFSPAKEIKGYLTHTVVLGHVVHCLTPSF